MKCIGKFREVQKSDLNCPRGYVRCWSCQPSPAFTFNKVPIVNSYALLFFVLLFLASLYHTYQYNMKIRS